MTRIPSIVKFFAGALLVGLVLAGCVTTSGTAKPNPKLAGKYLAKGHELEKKGDLPAALEQYKLALTADSKNAQATQERDRLAAILAKKADERYALGMKYYRQGKYGLARKQFLVALKYQPDHPKASKMLVSRKPVESAKYFTHVVRKGESLSMIAKKYYGDYKKYNVIARFNNLEDATQVKPGQTIMIPNLPGIAASGSKAMPATQSDRFVWHTIQPGQSISKLAQIYYGDYKKFHIIAQYNEMDDATQVKVGDRIKVPRVSGLPFTPPQAKKKPRPAPAPEPPAAVAVPPAEPPAAAEEPATEMTGGSDMTEPEETSKSEGDAQVLAYRDSGIELYGEGKYEDAIFELHKAVEAMPEDEQTRTYLAKSYYESGKDLYRQRDFEAAREAFESALQFDPRCADCATYIDKAKSGPIDTYRAEGIAHLERNEFPEAIAEFNKCLQLRPGDDELRDLLAQTYFQKALIDYNKGDFMIARQGFSSSLAFNDQCDKCASYITRSEESYKETHYNKGVVYYGKQQLQEAITEWEKVQELDPGYKEVEQNLTRARELMEKLEKIKKSRQQ